MYDKNISNSNNLSPFVSGQLPEFVRIDHPTFIAFLECYYEWINQSSNIYNASILNDVRNIDKTLNAFIDMFKSQYLKNFPSSLAISSSNTPLNYKTLIKHIKSFYKAKGTEKSYELLFRILYDTNVEFYYPKVDLLRVSDGKWIANKTIRIGISNGSKVFESLGKTVYQLNNSGIFANAVVTDVSKFQIGVFSIYELTLNGINGTFNTNYPLYLKTDSSDILEPKVYSVVSSITISNGGSGYRVGDPLIFTNASGDIGQGAKAKVSQISSTGKILKIKIENFGVNYLAAPTISISSVSGSGFSGTTSIGAICNFEGYYANGDGKLSSLKVIQDSHYYQNYSYVLKSEIVIDRYKDIIKKLIHPAGLGFFGQILIKRAIKSNLEAASTVASYEVPIIGHYAPYCPLTYDNLIFWFLKGGHTAYVNYQLTGLTAGMTSAGYSPTHHDSLLLGVKGNPITNNKVFYVAPTDYLLYEVGFPRADPYWIIYRHPNTRITDPVTVRIEKDLAGLTSETSNLSLSGSYPNGTNMGLADFLRGSTGNTGWGEWTLTGQDRYNWINSFTGNYGYTKLRYNSSTEFRKISFDSFFHMPYDLDLLPFDSGLTHSGVGDGEEGGGGG